VFWSSVDPWLMRIHADFSSVPLQQRLQCGFGAPMNA
jgi:hypothetical protein